MQDNPMSGITNDVLAAKMDTASAQIGELKAQINAFGTIYARNDLLELRFKELDNQLALINLKIVAIEKKSSRSGFMSWVIGLIGVALGSVFTFLVLKQLGG